MRSLIFFLSFIVSFSVWSQSYLIMENGLILTTDEEGFLYDLGLFTYPHKVTLRGGNYFIEEGRVLATINDAGQLKRKLEKLPQTFLGRGMNYFISPAGEVYTIDSNGELHYFQKDQFKNVTHFGGTYFFVTNDSDPDQVDVYVIRRDGEIIKADLGTIPKNEIASLGGMYFMKKDGSLISFGENSQVNYLNNTRVGLLERRGGNFLIDSSLFIYAFNKEGEIKLPALPSSLKISSVYKNGTNYFVDESGRFYIVNKAGEVLERFLEDQDFLKIRIYSL
jgi:hypothetical protein